MSWMILYSRSASRWVDGYVSGGIDRDVDPEVEEYDFVFETGVKFRAKVSSTPLRFLSVLTDFWGIRIGIRNRGVFRLENQRYVVEFGAGTW